MYFTVLRASHLRGSGSCPCADAAMENSNCSGIFYVHHRRICALNSGVAAYGSCLLEEAELGVMRCAFW